MRVEINNTYLVRLVHLPEFAVECKRIGLECELQYIRWIDYSYNFVSVTNNGVCFNRAKPKNYIEYTPSIYNILEDDQFLIDNSEGVVEVDAQKLRSLIVQKIKTERELKVTQGKLEKLQKEVKTLRENEVSLKCSIAKKTFVDLTKY